MKLGTENRTTTIVAIVLFLVAIVLLVRVSSGGGRPASTAAPNTNSAVAAAAPQPQRARQRVRGRTTGVRNTPASAPLDPRLRLDLLARSERTEYTGRGRNIFQSVAEIPTPIEPVIVAKKETLGPEPPPPPPPPPPINLKFFGLASRAGEPTKIFLGTSTGEDVFVAGEGDIVNRRYKIVKVNPNSVEVEDVLSNRRQTIPLTAP